MKNLNRHFRNRHLTPAEIASDEEVRRKVRAEFPPANLPSMLYLKHREKAATMATETLSPTPTQLEQMHILYRQGGADRARAPHVIYAEEKCPHEGCSQSLRAIDFRLEAFGRAIHDPLVRAWWSDVGFVGRCPGCNGWIHFTILGKQAVDDAQAQTLPQLPANWADEAVVL